MSDKIEIIQGNYEQILELANSSNSRTDLLDLNGFDYNIFPNIHSRTGATLISEYTKEVLIEYVAQSHSFAAVLRLFDKSKSGASVRTLKSYIKNYGIDTSHFDLSHKYFDPKYANKKTNEEIFVKNSLVDTRTAKDRILRDNLIEYKCHGKLCNITNDWLGNKITLQLERESPRHKWRGFFFMNTTYRIFWGKKFSNDPGFIKFIY